MDVLPVQDVKDLAPYRAVVAGSAILGGQWLPEAMQFIQAHRVELAHKPFAAFLVCMTMSMPGVAKYREGVADWLKPVRLLVRPVSGGTEFPPGLFAGVLDISKVPSVGDRLKF